VVPELPALPVAAPRPADPLDAPPCPPVPLSGGFSLDEQATAPTDMATENKKMTVLRVTGPPRGSWWAHSAQPSRSRAAFSCTYALSPQPRRRIGSQLLHPARQRGGRRSHLRRPDPCYQLSGSFALRRGVSASVGNVTSNQRSISMPRRALAILFALLPALLVACASTGAGDSGGGGSGPGGSSASGGTGGGGGSSGAGGAQSSGGAAGAGAGGTSSSAKCPDTTWKLVWGDDFEGTAGAAVDGGKWTYDTGPNWYNGELQDYTSGNTNASLDGSGNLIIEARK